MHSPLIKPKAAIVSHSGGMDSSICLAHAIRCHGRGNVLSLTFDYGQRNATELQQARKIAQDWQVDHEQVDISSLSKLTHNALIDSSLPFAQIDGKPPNTLVMGRNGLWARLAAIRAHEVGADCIYMGVIEVESANSGYPDCSRNYMNLLEQILRLDLANPHFEIRTPVVLMTKKQTLEWALQLGILPYLLANTITCYEGIAHPGCQQCFSCDLRNTGIAEFLLDHPDFDSNLSSSRV